MLLNESRQHYVQVELPIKIDKVTYRLILDLRDTRTYNGLTEAGDRLVALGKELKQTVEDWRRYDITAQVIKEEREPCMPSSASATPS